MYKNNICYIGLIFIASLLFGLPFFKSLSTDLGIYYLGSKLIDQDYNSFISNFQIYFLILSALVAVKKKQILSLIFLSPIKFIFFIFAFSPKSI